MGLAIGPAAAAETQEWVGGAADVGIVDESQRGFMAQLSAYVGPLLKHSQHRDHWDDGDSRDRGDAIVADEMRNVGDDDCSGGGRNVDEYLPKPIRDMKCGECDTETGHRAGEQTLRQHATFRLAVDDE